MLLCVAESRFQLYSISKGGNKFDGGWVTACLYALICCQIDATTILPIVWTVFQLRWLIPGASPRRPCSSPRFVHVGFVVDEVAMEIFFLPINSIFHFSYQSISDEYYFMHHSDDGHGTHYRPHLHRRVGLSRHNRIQEYNVSSRIIMNR